MVTSIVSAPCDNTRGSSKMAEEQALIASAKDFFHAGKFGDCKATLNTLAAARPNDWKVSMNRTTVDFLGSEKKDLNSLQDRLTSLCAQMNVNLDAEKPDDVEHCVLFYNQAIVCLKQKRYHDALNIVNKIFPMVREMEGNLGRKVCILLLDLNTYLGDFDKALINLSTIEKAYNIPNTIPVLGDDKNDEHSSTDDSMHIQRFRMVLLEYKARIHLALADYDACNETIDTLICSGCLNFATSMIKAKLCYVQGKYEEALDALHLFMQGIDELAELPIESKMIFYNNLAIVNHKLTRSHSCSFSMNKSLHAFHDGVKNTPKESSSSKKYFSALMLFKLMYNRGVSLLYRGEPTKAFDCFLEVSQKMFRSPLLWLRLAECCIRINKPGNEETFDLAKRRKNLVSVFENVNNSSIILNNKIYLDSNYNSEPQSYAVPTPTMEFASICGKNALLLLSEGNNKLKLGVLAVNAYIRLSIGDPVLALKYATILLHESTSSPLYKYLARMYMSEAYMDLNQLNKAIEILDPSTHKDCDPTKENPGEDFLPKSPTAGQYVLLYNLAVVLVLRKEMDKATDLLRHVWLTRGTDGPVPVHVLALALYIELVQGRVDVARTIIKQNCPQVVWF